jgi:hypothetical protein
VVAPHTPVTFWNDTNWGKIAFWSAAAGIVVYAIHKSGEKKGRRAA